MTLHSDARKLNWPRIGFAAVAVVTYENTGGAENTSTSPGFQLRWVN